MTLPAGPGAGPGTPSARGATPEAGVAATVQHVATGDPFQPKGKTFLTLSDATTRQLLALSFFALFAATVVLSFVNIHNSSWANTKEWLQILLPAETALLGSATGFYFGSKSQS